MSGSAGGLRTAEFVLRGLVAIMLVGAGGTALLHGSPVGSVLWRDFGWSEGAFVALDRGAAMLLMATAAAVVLVPRGRGLLCAVPAGLWLVLVPIAELRAGGDFGHLLAPFAQGNRPLAIAALVLWAGPARFGGTPATALTLLRVGLAAVFLAHGIEALAQHPAFVDYLITTTERLTPWSMSEGTARDLLLVIGAQDILLSILIWHRGSRTVLQWALFWGLATALMRLVYFGPAAGAYYAAIRALNGGGALMLLLMLRAGVPHPVWGWRPRAKREQGVAVSS